MRVLRRARIDTRPAGGSKPPATKTKPFGLCEESRLQAGFVLVARGFEPRGEGSSLHQIDPLPSCQLALM
jgi:hypothetical protein